MKNNIRRCFIWRKASLATCVILFTACLLLQSAQAQTQWTTTGTNISNGNAGNVGVGTSSPTGKLSVELPNSDYINNGGANSHILLTNPSASGQTILESFINGSLAGKWRTDYVGNMSFATGGGSYSFMTGGDYPNGVNRFSILNSGNVGVGTGSPNGLLAVVSSHPNSVETHIQNTNTSGYSALRLGVDAVSANGGAFEHFGGTWNGTGLTTPSTTAVIGFEAGGLNLGAFHSSGVIKFFTGGIYQNNERIRIEAGGNVGIGTTAPAYKLDVAGPINATGFYVNGSPLQVGGGGGSQWTTNGTSVYYTSGNVGIGTGDPQSLLHVAGRIRTDNDILSIGGGGQQAWRDATESSAINFGMTVPGQAATNDMYFSTYRSGGAWMPRMVISNASGNVGIGTSMPAANLEVSSPSATRLNITTSSTTSNQPGVQFTSNYSANPGERNWYMGTSYYALGDFLIRQSNATGGDPYSSASSTPRFYIGSSGNVGIGTSAPAATLDVTGSLNASGTITGGNIVAKYQDVAEWVPTSKAIPAGTVVVLDASQSNYVTSSSKSYDTRVAGVVSTQPGIALGESGANKVLVATTGRVKVKVDATRASIHVGDLLVTGTMEGAAMKSEPLSLGGVEIHRPGTLIGKALEPLEKGTGEILVLLSLQ